MDQLWALFTVNTASSYSWIKQVLPDFKPVYIKAQWIYKSHIKDGSNVQLPSLPPIPPSLQKVLWGGDFVIKTILQFVEAKMPSNTLGKSLTLYAWL